MAKAPDAFRTISEVSEQLDTPAHVLRFWESKFTQVKPVKRAGGRRYYRPEDMALLGGIKVLLHDQGMTIKGAQKLLREQGAKAVAKMMAPPDDYASDAAGVGAVIDTVAVTEPVGEFVHGTLDVHGTSPSSVKDGNGSDGDTAVRSVLPDLPAARPLAEGRILGLVCTIHKAAMQRKAAQIAPVLERLREHYTAMLAS